jgi:predicted glycosyltransferase
MNILIFLSHPAQFLFYRCTIIELRKKGSNVLIVIKSKDILANLLDESGLDYFNILPKERGRSKLSILLSVLARDFKLFRFVRKRNIHLLLGSDASLAHVGWLLEIPCVTTLEDDYPVVKNLARLTFPFTSNILVPSVCNVGKWGKKKIGYDGYMKLAYLHPLRFTPSREKVLLDHSEAYCIIRLSSLGAHHDFGIEGISDEFLGKIIALLEANYKVYISSERPLSPELEKYRLSIKISDVHHYLYYANILVCDSQSMAVEAAMLGVPSIRISGFSGRISVLEELERKYHLTFGFQPNQEEVILNKIKRLQSEKDMRQQFQQRRQKMLSEKIDVSAFLIWFIENFPTSVNALQENSDIQSNFK